MLAPEGKSEHRIPEKWIGFRVLGSRLGVLGQKLQESMNLGDGRGYQCTPEPTILSREQPYLYSLISLTQILSSLPTLLPINLFFRRPSPSVASQIPESDMRFLIR